MTSFSRGKIAQLLGALKPAHEPEVPEASRISVHAAVSRFAFLYEKVRNAVDYKDDHLLRKAAIVRILKRQFALEPDPSIIAQNLIRELIGARYLPNGVLPESLIGEAAVAVKKYLMVSSVRVGGDRFRSWLLGVVAAELEEILDDHSRDKALLNFLFESLGDRITLRGAEMDQTDRRLQVYIACLRALSKADDEMLAYKLVRAYHSEWVQEEQWLETPQVMAQEMVEIAKTVNAQLKHRLGQKFFHAVKPWAIALGMLRDALLERPEHSERLLEHPEELHAVIGRIAERRYQDSRGKLRRGTFRAIIYIFFTKILLALAIEVPFETLLYKEVRLLSLGINIGFPPVLMFLIGSLIRVPGKENVKRIQQCVDELLSVEGPKGREIRIPKKRGFFARFFLRLAYAMTFLVTFGLIYKLLTSLQFTWVSSLIFIFFLCIVSFFAFRLRLAAREYVVVDRAERFSTVLIDFFSLPILRAGQWLSMSVSRINIFIFFFDFIVETPYKIFLNVLEEWFAFMKEKKEELQ